MNQLSVLRVLTCVLAVAVTVGCTARGDTEAKAAAPVVALPPKSAGELRAVPTVVALDLPLQASVYAWRDFSPVIDSATATRDLRVSVQLRGGAVAPRAIACGGMYLVVGDSVFTSSTAEQRAGDGPGAIECVIRGAPSWPVGATVQVIARVFVGESSALIRRETTIDETS
jgi:hypothetical protein